MKNNNIIKGLIKAIKCIRYLILIVPLMLMLQGCPVLIIGGVVAGASAYLNKQSLKTYYSDSNLRFEINRRFGKTPALKHNTHLVVAVYKGVVLLAGQVTRPSQRIKAVQIIKGIPGIQRIYNEITISGLTSTLTRSSDAWITSKIKSDMLMTDGLKSKSIKIVTENGVVYLMGEVNNKQAKLAANIARRVPGVQRVVTLFEIKK